MTRSRIIALATLMLAFSIVGGARAEYPSLKEDIVAPRTAAALVEVFAAKSYALEPLRESGIAPRIHVHQVPLDMASIAGVHDAEVHDEKSLFIRTLLLRVLKANEEIPEQGPCGRSAARTPGGSVVVVPAVPAP